jgi:hypothetical protein
MQEQYPGSDDGESAKEGNDAHAAVASHLRNTRSEGGVIVPGDPEMTDAINVYYNDVMNVVKARNLSMNSLYVEQKVFMPQVHNNVWGTLDAGIFDTNRREIINWDFKYGWGLVDEWENEQGILYLLGLWNLNPDIIPEPKRFIFRLVQPRPYCPRGRVREYSFDWTTMQSHVGRIRAKVQDALSSNPTLKSGPHCRDCTALLHCPAATDMAAKGLDTSTLYHGINLSPEALGREYDHLLKAKEVINHRLTVLKEQMFSTIGSGKNIPGWAIDNVPGRKTWTVPPDRVVALGDMFGIDLRKPSCLTVAQTLKLKKIPEETVMMLVKQSGKMDLIKDDGRKARQIFGGENGD